MLTEPQRTVHAKHAVEGLAAQLLQASVRAYQFSGAPVAVTAARTQQLLVRSSAAIAVWL
jgi:hypothetical protein